MKRIKTITSHAGYARFLELCLSAGRGFVARRHVPANDRYSYGPTKAVLEMKDGRLVIIVETSHKHYEVWQVPQSLVRQTESEAAEEHLAKT